MAFTLEDVEKIRRGEPRQVGVLPDKVWKKLGWRCPWVYLGRSGLQHIAERHRDITDFDLLWMPLAIASGVIVHIEKSPRQILVGYEAEPDRFYRAALKEAQNGTEVWVDSFYRVKIDQIKNISKEGPILRDHQ